MVRSLVIFDLDGTLADTLADIAAAMNRTLAAFGLPTHAPDFYAQYVGEGVDRLVEQVLAPESRRLHEEVTAAFRTDYSHNLLAETAPYPGVPELLDSLEIRGVEVAILSNKPDPMTRRVARALFSRWRFCAVLGRRPEVPKKPDPAAALEIAAGAGREPGACALVGDTPIDIRTAAAAGMAAIGVQWGFRRRDDLIAAGADAVIEEPGEIISLVTGS